MRSFTVQAGLSSYDVWIGQDLFLSDLFLKTLRRLVPCDTPVLILCDQKLKAFGRRLQTQLPSSSFLSVRVSEEIKSLSKLPFFYEKLIKACPNRQSVLIVLGGGVLGDLGGFLAATYLRGIRWINFPTTLLSQVDSSIGGKTAVNLPTGKNLIGAFHPPTWVVIDLRFLETLPKREWISGWGEIFKMALVFDPHFYRKLKKVVLPEDPKPLLTKQVLNQLESIIHRSLILKKKIVEQDEKDIGVREFLNFGHTLGHALEAATHYKKVRHGEAVFFGMIAAVYLSQTEGLLESQEGDAIRSLLERFFFPSVRLTKPNLNSKIKKCLRRDKKQDRDGSLRFVCLRGVGYPEMRVISEKVAFEVCDYLLLEKNGPEKMKGSLTARLVSLNDQSIKENQ